MTFAEIMAEILTGVSAVFTEAVSWMGDLIGVITGNPVLVILCVAMPLIGFGVGILKRVTNAL